MSDDSSTQKARKKSCPDDEAEYQEDMKLAEKIVGQPFELNEVLQRYDQELRSIVLDEGAFEGVGYGQEQGRVVRQILKRLEMVQQEIEAEIRTLCQDDFYLALTKVKEVREKAILARFDVEGFALLRRREEESRKAGADLGEVARLKQEGARQERIIKRAKIAEIQELQRIFEERKEALRGAEIRGLRKEIEALQGGRKEEYENGQSTEEFGLDEGFRSTENYRAVWLGGKQYNLSWTQSLVVKFLHGLHVQGVPSAHEKEIFAAIDEESGYGSETEKNARREAVGKTRRLINVFGKDDPRSVLITKEGNAFYRLNIPF